MSYINTNSSNMDDEYRVLEVKEKNREKIQRMRREKEDKIEDIK